MISLKNSIVEGWFFDMKFYLMTVNADDTLISLFQAGNTKNNISLKILKALSF
jgi:hypothetical protein